MSRKAEKSRKQAAIERHFYVDTAISFKGQEIRVLVNDTTARRIREYLPVIMELRGIKATSNIDIRDEEVAAKIASGMDTQQAIEVVRNKYKAAEEITFGQVSLWAIVYDSVFTVTDTSFGWEVDVEVPESYWEQEPAPLKTDPLQKLKQRYLPRPVKVKLDKENPFEMMLAVVSVMMQEEPSFKELLESAGVKAYTLASGLLSERSADEIGFLGQQVAGVLSGDVDEEGQNGDRKQPRHRVRLAEQSAGQRPEDAGDEAGSEGGTGDPGHAD